MGFFVSEQEEELRQQFHLIDKLQQQLKSVAQEQSSQLLKELVEEQDRYRFLQETLVGQRRNLKRLEDTFKQHQQLLWKRQEANKVKPKPPLLASYHLHQEQWVCFRSTRKLKFKISYVVIYVVFPVVILLITLPSAIFRLPPSLIFKALGDEQARHAVFSGNSSQLQTHLKGMGVEEEKLYDYLQTP